MFEVNTSNLKIEQASGNYGLKKAVLKPVETFAQSIAGIAPSATPAMLLPILFGFAHSGTWFCFVIATCGLASVASSINQFAKRSASPGSLYTFVQKGFGEKAALLTGWSMVFAYLLCAACCSVEVAVFASAIAKYSFHMDIMPIIAALTCSALVSIIAYKHVKLSASIMLQVEFLSIVLISILVLLVLNQHHFKIDMAQATLKGVTIEQVRMGLVMAIFGFVGFESAASLGVEAIKPLRSIPQAIMRSVIFTGLFFLITSYGVILGFSDIGQNLATCPTPLFILSEHLRLPAFGQIINMGVMISFLGACLASINAGARTLFYMGHHGAFPKLLSAAHDENGTPHIAIIILGVLSAVISATLIFMNYKLLDIVGWLGSLASYGFIFAYISVSAASIVFLKKIKRLNISNFAVAMISLLIMSFALLGSIYPIPPAPYSCLPIIFAVYLIMGAVFLKTTEITIK